MLYSRWLCNEVMILILVIFLLVQEQLGSQLGRKHHHEPHSRTKRKHGRHEFDRSSSIQSGIAQTSKSFLATVVSSEIAENTTNSIIDEAEAFNVSRTVTTTAPALFTIATNQSRKNGKSMTSTKNSIPNIESVTNLPILKDKANKTKRSRHKVISIKSGKIKGQVIELESDRKVFAYRGIPYGENTSGKHRFKPPRPIKAWNGTRDALEYGNTCFQLKDTSFDESYRKDFKGTMMWNPNTKLSEDCLYLNVWTPASPKKSKHLKLAVMVWIYGGSFLSGTSSLATYNGAWLASKQKVVVVSMNYRVAGLGFLALDGDEITGNAGLLDQQLALKWVQNNIRFFGGNPHNVTLFGESSGAASISLHLMSQKSKGLFNNVILQSASLLSPWAFLDRKEANRRALKLAEALNCTQDFEDSKASTKNKTKKNMIACLQSVDPLAFVSAEIAMESYGIAMFPNAAVIDGDFLTTSPFDDESPAHWNTDVNVLAGFNANEGNYFIVYSPILKYDLKKENNITRKVFMKGVREAIRSMSGTNKLPDHAKNILATSADFTYTSGHHPVILEDESGEMEKKKLFVPKEDKFAAGIRSPSFYRDRLDDMVGDVSFVCPTIRFLDKYNKQLKSSSTSGPKKQTYLYKFVQRSSQNPWPEWMGVMHGYEIEFVFGLPLNKSLQYTEEERIISNSMMKMWANFAKYGDPNNRHEPEVWPPYNETTKYIYVIGDSGKESKQYTSSLYSSSYSSQLTHCAFWGEHYPLIQKKLEEAPPCPTTRNSRGAGNTSRYSSGVLWTILFLITVKTFSC